MQDRIHGTTMPVLELRLEPGEHVVAEAGEMSWMSAGVRMSTTTGGGGIGGIFKRMAGGGGSLFMTEYHAEGGPGMVAFAAKMPGTILPVDVHDQPGGTYVGHRSGFMCGTDGVVLDWYLQQKLGAGIFGGAGFALQKITGEGRAWIELSGEVIPYDLKAGQSLQVHPGHVGLFQDTVSFDITTVSGIANRMFGGNGVYLAHLTGPGRVYLQSLPISRLASALSDYLPSASGDGARTINLFGNNS